MTPVSPIYKVLVLYGISFFGVLGIAELVCMLRENKWNIYKTIIQIIKEW